MDPLRINLSLIALAACLAYLAWIAFCVVLRRCQSGGSAPAEVLLSCSLLVAAGVNGLAADTYPLPSSTTWGVLVALAGWLAARIGCRRPGHFGANVAVAPALLVVAAAWNFHSSTRESLLEFAVNRPVAKVPVDDALVVTDQGRIFSVFRFDTEDHGFQESHPGVFENRIIRVASHDVKTNCHGWVFVKGRYGIPAGAVAALLQDNGYSVVSAPLAGDVVVYRDQAGGIVHSGRVRRVHDGGQIWIESKWGAGGRFLHRPEDQCYSATFEFYRSRRSTHEAQIVRTSATKDARVARYDGRPPRRARG